MKYDRGHAYTAKLKYILDQETKRFWEMAEEGFFSEKSGWEDDSSGNYVGWIKTFEDFNIIISRSRASEAGEYSITKTPEGIMSGSDPLGVHPEWYDEIIGFCDLDTVKFYLDLL